MPTRAPGTLVFSPPKQVRETLGMAEGSYLLFRVSGRKIIAEKASIGSLSDFRDLATEVEGRIRESGIQPEDAEEAVRWSRRRLR